MIRMYEIRGEDWCVGGGFFVFFFFQAEDGIRDHCVTGVQTCALPIYDFHFIFSMVKLSKVSVSYWAT